MPRKFRFRRKLGLKRASFRRRGVAARRSNRRFGRKFPRSSAKGRGYTRTWIRGKTPFKDACFVKLSYVETFAVSNAAGLYYLQVYRGNSLYDPDFTGVGHQPYFFDEYCSNNGPYFDYRVLGSKIKATVIPYDESSSSTGYRRGVINLTVIPNLSSGDLVTATGSTAFDDLTCMGYAKSKLVDLNWGSLKDHTIQHYMNTGRLEGKTNYQIESDPTYLAVYNANPASQWFWHLYIGEPTNVVANTCFVRVKLDYYVKFEHRANTAAS